MDQVVFMTAEGVALAVHIVFEKMEDGLRAVGPFHFGLRLMAEIFHEGFPGQVRHEQVTGADGLGRGVFGMGPHVQVDPRPIGQEGVRRPVPPLDRPEEQSRQTLRAGVRPFASRIRHLPGQTGQTGQAKPVLGLQTHDPTEEGHGSLAALLNETVDVFLRVLFEDGLDVIQNGPHGLVQLVHLFLGRAIHRLEVFVLVLLRAG